MAMRNAVWVLVGLVGTAICTAFASRVRLGYVVPDFAVIVVAFLAMRREPITLVFIALVLGYLVGRQAIAPVGLHETALVGCALSLYLIAGHLAGEGALYFGFISGVAVIGYHVLLYLLLRVWREHAAFSSFATAVLFPNAAATALLAVLTHRPMAWLEHRLSAERREGLGWR